MKKSGNIGDLGIWEKKRNGKWEKRKERRVISEKRRVKKKMGKGMPY
ncbi:MAG: hypothetical protein J6C92_07855 [Bacteroidaceae bacterium]|nr:hypothetical protein [Bacteroidaceae bacterium]